MEDSKYSHVVYIYPFDSDDITLAPEAGISGRDK